MAKRDLAAYVVKVDSVDRRKHDQSYPPHGTDWRGRSSGKKDPGCVGVSMSGETWCVRRGRR